MTYKLPDRDKTFSPKELTEFIDYSNKKPKINKNNVDKFINSLAEKYNTLYDQYSFNTSYHTSIKVNAHYYGRILNKDRETEYLINALKAKQSDMHKLTWSQNFYNNSDGIGDSYIEISLSGQYVWLYKNGKLIAECPCVTGGPKTPSPKGLFSVQYVNNGPMTLKGENSDGTKYESKVNCFIPFYGDVGLHGADGWRSSYGGSIYKTNGSHGCINCPDSVAKKIANNVERGYPVVVY